MILRHYVFGPIKGTPTAECVAGSLSEAEEMCDVDANNGVYVHQLIGELAIDYADGKLSASKLPVGTWHNLRKKDRQDAEAAQGS